MSENVLIAIISGSFAIVGACAGGFFAVRASARQNLQQLLLEACSEVFSAYAKYVTAELMVYPPAEVISAIDTSRLLCGKETEEILSEFEANILQKKPSSEKLGSIVKRLRLAARKEVKNA